MTGPQQPERSTGDPSDELTALLATPVEALGLDLEAVEVTSAGKRRLLRVAVDKDGGVSMDDVADATRAVNEVLEARDTLPGLGAAAYTLEVGSPGVGRPLSLPRHWRRNTDRLVKTRLTDGETLTGRVRQAGETSVRLDVSGTDREIAYADVARATVQVEFAAKEK
ncbi:ribosome maturation factor RimP [Marmoricola endophyticus]|uniref:Ribosome maturation factor RimP n=1 Tax=Marmoricola endophyticus TaxID=2040280 RepID=A0A917BEZ0_9ACTN|nr:ribosome maturation factor RimP [Marmoricola endophyticus]GGF38526.1 ribosome maturation factor RimP [Marmoricola endophyticus]